MYASKRFSFSRPVYEARIFLAGLDYNHHVHRAHKRKPDGSAEYVVLFIYNLLLDLIKKDSGYKYFHLFLLFV